MRRKAHGVSSQLSVIASRMLLGMTMMASCQAQDKPSGQPPKIGNGKQPTEQLSVKTSYRVVSRYKIGGEGGWDYISIDSQARRLYVSHATQVEVLDADSGRIVGQIIDTPDVHGVALASELHHGFTSNGGDKSVTIFDTKTLAPIKKVQLQSSPDFILYDPFTKRVFALSHATTVLDAQTGEVAGIVDLGGNPEAGISDGKGIVYINLADKNAIAAVDSQTLAVRSRFVLDYCTSPHSLSYDPASRRLFVGCHEGLIALDATTGKTVGGSLMCSGVDASGFDVEYRQIFESCAEGVVSIIQEITPDAYQLSETIPTQLWARTMVFDPESKRIFLPTAESVMVTGDDPKKPPRFKIKSGSFTVLVLERQ